MWHVLLLQDSSKYLPTPLMSVFVHALNVKNKLVSIYLSPVQESQTGVSGRQVRFTTGAWPLVNKEPDLEPAEGLHGEYK